MKTLMTIPGTAPIAFTVTLDVVAGVLPAADRRLKILVRTDQNGVFANYTPRHTK